MMLCTPIVDLGHVVHCYKMHGLGNDYIYVLDTQLPEGIDLQNLARQVSDRYFGVGSDGLVLLGKGKDADLYMRIWNSDGSEAQMCGNASRCVALLAYSLGLVEKTDLTLDTLAGVKNVHINLSDCGRLDSVSVDMGKPILEPSDIPVDTSVLEGTPGVACLTVEGAKFAIQPVGMGNPHGVIFLNHAPDDNLVHGKGPLLERHDMWPEKANIEFAHILNPRRIEMRVWERGSGETMACGTGSCATAVAAMRSGLVERNVEISLPGGVLEIEWREDDGHVIMTGPAHLTAEIEFFMNENKSECK